MAGRGKRHFVNQGARPLRVEPLESRLLLAADFELLKNISPEPGGLSSEPELLTVVGDTTYFIASDPAHGKGLWKSDGSAAGTTFVTRIDLGPRTRYLDLVAAGDTLYIVADDDERTPFDTIEIFASDGSAEGTTLVKSWIKNVSSWNPLSYLGVGDTLFVVAGDSEHGYELWKSDGTPDGTQIVKDIKPGAEASGISSLTEVGGTLYFAADDGVHGKELWKSDGTAEGTVLVKDIREGAAGSSLGGFVELGGSLYFVANDAVHGKELWKTDGTSEGTELVLDLNEGTGGSTLSGLTAGDDYLYFFISENAANNGLWKSNGTAAGTENVFADVSAGGYAPVTAGNRLFFHGISAIHGNGFWTSDGTSEGTERLQTTSSLPAVAGEYVYFVSSDGISGNELWRSDGTEAGTEMVLDLNPGSAHAGIEEIVVMGDTVLLAATDGVIGKELWKVDPLTGELVLVKDISYATLDSRNSLTVVDGKLFFNAKSPELGYELWVTDGSEAGTQVTLDLNPGAESGVGTSILTYAWNGKLFYYPRPSELWVSDGTPEGTSLLSASRPLWFHEAGGNLYFESDGSLWKTDGTPEGTEEVKFFQIRNTGQRLGYPTSLGDILYFVSWEFSGSDGSELWRSDGTPEGTYLVKDINADESKGSNPQQLTVLGDSIYFITREQHSPWATFWKTDGTEEGTVSIQEWFGGESLRVEKMFATESRLLLFIRNNAGEVELWTSDGTAEGTELVGPAGLPSGDTTPLVVGNTLYYATRTDANGTELWKTDGTAAGTGMVKDIYPGTTGANPGSFVFFNGWLYFAASSPEGNQQLWRTDGTAEGTVPAIEGSQVTGLGSMTLVGTRLYASGFTPEYGHEIYFTDLAPELPGDFNLDGTVDTADYALWKANYGATSGHALVADGNLDGVVNVADYTLWRNNLGKSLPVEAALAAMALPEEPEPAREVASMETQPRVPFVPPPRSGYSRSSSDPPTARQEFATASTSAEQARRELLLLNRDAAFASLAPQSASSRVSVRGEWEPLESESDLELRELVATGVSREQFER